MDQVADVTIEFRRGTLTIHLPHEAFPSARVSTRLDHHASYGRDWGGLETNFCQDRVKS